MIRKLTMVLVGLFFGMGMALAQTQITGTVVSQDDGEPIVGATVRVVGTQVGVASDIDGHFTLTLP
ncbi:MAG: carboxypeptidase-like regulatory domain-containing protein, partial [Prevotella sp.]|nr:carboxypeptidase-like regulatory domain-containing protein [Prevotella sp.]